VTIAPHTSCRDALRRLDDYVDRTLSPEELRLVEAHLKRCVRCAEQFRFEVTLIRDIRDRLQRLTVPPNLLRGIRLRLRALPPKEPFPRI
jgi:anti-sigma factor RsiW